MKRGFSRPLPSREQGMVLIVVLIMLGLLTVIVAAMVRTGTVNFRVAGNQQYHQEGRMAAQNEIESYISAPGNFGTAPPTKTNGIDLDGDGTEEYTATVLATPIGESPAPATEIRKLDHDTQTACLGSDLGAEALDPKTEDSINRCKHVTWDVVATATDAVAGTTSTSVVVHQGITVLTKK